MKRIGLINGSPKGENSCSKFYLDTLKDMLKEDNVKTYNVNVVKCQKENTCSEMFEEMLKSDTIIIAFPLYIDSIPSHLLEFLTEFEVYYKNSNSRSSNVPSVYAIINNGFIEGTQNVNAVKNMHHFASCVGLNWRFAIGVGAGEFMRETIKDIPLKSKMKKRIYNALMKIKKDIVVGEVAYEKDIYTNPVMTKKMFMIAGTMHWKQKAKKNNLRKKELSNKPYTNG